MASKTTAKKTTADLVHARLVAHCKACPGWWREPGLLQSECIAIAAEFDLPWPFVASELAELMIAARDKSNA